MTIIPIPETPGPLSEPANKFTRDAQERMAHLRTIAAEFPDDADPKPLTTAEIRLARGTSAAMLENAAIFVEASPAVGGAVADVAQLRDAIEFELAYGGVRNEARAFARNVDLAILRRKLKAAKAARGVYRVAKGHRRRRRHGPAPRGGNEALAQIPPPPEGHRGTRTADRGEEVTQ